METLKELFLENPIIKLLAILAGGFIIGVVIYQLVKRTVHEAFDIENKRIDQKLKVPFYCVCSFIAGKSFFYLLDFGDKWQSILSNALFIIFVISLAWLGARVLRIVSLIVERQINTGSADNLRARKIMTQFSYIKKIGFFLLFMITLCVILLSIDSVRELGLSLLASAGLTGIIIGLAAQKTISNLLAGFQIAFTQPIRLDDVVIVENEWGRIEEITLTYVVMKIWDERRLIIPLSYFIEKPFQNWTRTRSDLLGSVYLWVDYSVPIEKLREELRRLLNTTPLWDKKVEVLQVVETSEKCIQLRALMTAKDSPTAWDLRCFIREGLITYIQNNYPDSLPKLRIVSDFSADKQKHHEQPINSGE